MITFCGIFSSGKSSLINCLLDYDEFKLPTGINPLTKLVTKIKYGKELKLYYISNGNRIYLIKNKFEELVTGVSAMPNDCREIIVEIPSKMLETGVVILDTPGFEDEMGGELEKISRDAIARADIVIICTSAIYFGNMLEQDLVAEISKSHGDFIMAVNRMDGVNSQKDMQSIRRRAENFVKSNNSSIISGSMGRNLFFTTADGQSKDLDGLDSSLAYILTNNSVLSDIKRSIFANKMSVAIEKLSSKIALSIAEEQEKLEAIREKDKQKRKELKHQLIVENSKNQTKKDVQINRYKVKLNSHLDKVYKYINQLEQDGRWHNFSVNTKKFLTTQLEYLVSDIHADYCYDYHTLELINYFNRRVDNFTIPKPIAKSVKRRGFLQRLGETVKTAIDYGILDIDDGYDLICENYAAPAIKAIGNELKPKLQNIIEQIISWRYAPQSEESIETGYEKEINELEEEIKRLYCCEIELKNYNITRLIASLKAAVDLKK